MQDVYNKIQAIAPTTNQLISLFTALASIGIANRPAWDPNAPTAIDRLIKNRDFASAFKVLEHNARDFVAGGSKSKELQDLVINVGFIKLSHAVINMILKAVT